MKSNTKYLLVTAAVLVVLGGTLTALLLNGKNIKSAAASTSSIVDQITVLNKTSADVASMKVTNEQGSYTLVPQLPSEQKASSKAESASSSQTSSTEEPKITYTVQELNGLPVDTTLTQQTAQNGYKLTATGKIGKVEKPADYGLEKPKAVVEVQYQDGSTFRYEVGNTAPTDNSTYYLRINGVVYMVDIDANLLGAKEKFLSTSVLSFANKDNSVPLFTDLTMSGTALQTPISINKTDDGYAITSPVSASMDSDKAASLTDMLTTLNAESAVAAHSDAAKLKSYGLEQPANILSFKQGGKMYTLLSGAKTGEDRYVMLKGIDVVYKVANSSLSTWVDAAKAFDLRSKYILVPNIENVKSVRITVGDAQHVYEVTRTKDEKKSTDDKTVYAYTVKKDLAEPVDYDTVYKKLFQNLIGLTLLEDTQQKPVGEPAYQIEYSYFDSNKKDTIEFHIAGNRRYITMLNGTVFGNVTENDVKFLQE